MEQKITREATYLIKYDNQMLPVILKQFQVSIYFYNVTTTSSSKMFM